MKILYIIHQFYPEFQTGTEKFIFNIASMAQKFGNKVKVITYSFIDDTKFDHTDGDILYRDYFYHGIPVIAFKHKKQPDDIHIALENKSLKRFANKLLKQEKPDVIHVGHPMRVHEFIWEAINLGIPYIITLTDFFMICPKYLLAPNDHSLCSGPQGGQACQLLCKEFSYQFITKRLALSEELLHNSKMVISPSLFLSTIINCEFNKLKIQIIHHGIDQRYIDQNSRTYSKNSLITFGYAGTLIHHKGAHVLLKAFDQIKYQNVYLEIYGAGIKAHEELIKRIVTSNKHVNFHGKYSNEELGDIMESIDVMVVPSIWYENYPLVLHEALASCVPVIATNLGGMAEKIIDGINGYTFSPGDTADLRKKMEIIIRNPTVLNGMKLNIKHNMVIPKVEQEAYEYNRIYQSIII